MLIAIPVESEGTNTDTPICPSLGRSPFFLLYDTESKSVKNIANPGATAQGGAGIKAAQTLVDNKVGAVLVPRCGENAANVLNSANIPMFKSIEGNVAKNIESYVAGKLEPLSDIHPGFHKKG